MVTNGDVWLLYGCCMGLVYGSCVVWVLCCMGLVLYGSCVGLAYRHVTNYYYSFILRCCMGLV
jgi:hypothetical protein